MKIDTYDKQQRLGHCSLLETERYVELAGGHHDWVNRV